MPLSPTADHVQLLAQLYEQNPELFSPEDVGRLVEEAEQTGVQLPPEVHENYLTEIPKQLLGGFIQGFSVFVDPFDEPRSVAGRIAKSVGGVFGFVGSFFGLGAATKGIGKGLGVLAKTAQAGKVSKEVSATAKTLAKMGYFLERTKLRSVPLAAADLAERGLKTLSAYNSALTSLEKIHPILRQATKGAIHLGIASGVSGIPEGVKGAVHSALWGGMAGAAFAGIGNIPAFQAETTLNSVAKATAGSIFMGLPSTLQGQTTPEQIYHYLLGGYFGYHTPSATTAKAMEVLQEIPEFERPWAATKPRLREETPAVQKAVIQMVTDMYRVRETGQGVADIAEAFPGLSRFANDLRKEAAFGMGRHIQSKKDPAANGPIISINVEDQYYQVRRPDRTAVTIDFKEAEPWQAPREDPKTRALDIDDMPGFFDFDGAMAPISPKVARFVEKLLGKKVSLEDYLHHIHDINGEIDRMVVEARRDVALEGGSVYTKAYQNFERYANEIARATTGKDLPREAFADITQYFTRQVQGESVPLVYLDKGVIKPYPSVRSGNGLIDPDLNRVDNRRSRLLFTDLTGDPNQVIIIDSMLSPFPGIARKREWSDVTFFETWDPKQGPPETRDMASLKDLFNAVRQFQLTPESPMGEYYIFGGIGEKPKLLMAKHLVPANEVPARFEAAMQEVEAVRPGFQKQYLKYQKNAVDQGLLSPAEYQRQFLSNMEYMRQFTGRPFGEMADPKNSKKFIQNILDFNKRQPLFFTDFYSMDVHHTGVDQLRYVMMEDYANLGKKAFKQKLGIEASDGAVLVRDDLLRRLLYTNGLPDMAGFAKTVFLSRDPDLGLMLGKMALHAAGPEMTAAMKNRQIDFIVPRTAAKQSGNRVFNDVEWDPKAKDFVIKPLEGEAVQTYTMLPSDIKLSFGTYDPAKISPMNRMAKQLMGQITFEQGGPDAQLAMESLLLAQMKGTERGNEALQSYLKEPTDANLKKMISWTPEGEIDPVALISEVGIEPLFAAARTDPKLRGQLYAYVLRNATETLKNGEIELLMDEGDEPTQIQRLRGALSRIKVHPGESIPDSIVLQKHVIGDFNRMIQNFVINRLTRPHLGNSFKAYIRSYDMELQKRLPLNDKVFYSDDAGKAMIMEGVTATGEKKRMQLGKQWTEYVNLRKLFEQPPPAKLAAPQRSDFPILERVGKISPDWVLDRSGKVVLGGEFVDIPREFLDLSGKPTKAELQKAPGNKKLGAADQQAQELGFEDTGAMLRELESSAKSYQEQVAQYKEAAAESPFARHEGYKKLLKQMEDAMRAVVLRVPMDDLSGAQSLRFAGWTGRPGTGILISQNNMKKLGGADLDIDSVFGYFGLDPAIHKALVKHSNDFALYRNEYPEALMDAVITKINPDIADVALPKGEQPYALMFDPYSRIRVAHAVSKGRNQLLGRAVANRFTIHSFFSTVNNSKLIPMTKTGVPLPVWFTPDGKMHYTPPPGKDAVETALKGYREIQHGRGKDKVRFYVRADDGLMLRAASSRMINLAADVAGRGGIIDPAEMRALFLHAAFPKIELMKYNAKTKKYVVEDISAGTYINARAGSEGYAGPRRVLSPALLDFARKGVFRVDLFQRIQDANQRFYGYNFQAGRHWTEPEIRQAAEKFPQDLNHPLRTVARTIANLPEFTTDNARLFIKGNVIEDFNRQLGKIKGLIEDMQGEGKFGFLREHFRPNYQQLISRLRVLRIHAQSPRYNVFEIDGRRNLANSEPLFEQFFTEMERAIDKTWKVGDMWHGKPLEKATKQADLLRKDLFPLWRKRQDGSSYSVFSKRERYLERRVGDATDLISTRIKTIADLAPMAKAYDEAGMEAYDTPANPAGRVKAKEWLRDIQKMRDTYAFFFKQRSDQGRINDTPASYEQLLERWLKVKTDAREWVAQENALGRSRDWQRVNHFLDTAMYNALSAGARTYSGRFGEDLVPAHVIREANDSYDRVFQTAISDQPLTTERIKKFLFQQESINRTISAIPVEEQHAITQDLIVIPKRDKSVIIGDEVQEITRDIIQELKRYDGITFQDLWYTARRVFGIAQPSDMTIFEYRGLREMVKSWGRTPGIFREIISEYVKSGKKKIPVSTRHWMNFMTTTADDLRQSSLEFAVMNLYNKDGTLNRGELRPLKHWDPQYNRIQAVYAAQAEPISFLHQALDIKMRASSHIAQSKAMGKNLADKYLGWIARGVQDKNGNDVDWAPFVELAVTQREANGAIDFRKDLERKRHRFLAEDWRFRPTLDAIRKAQETENIYVNHLQKAQKIREKLGAEDFVVMRPVQKGDKVLLERVIMNGNDIVKQLETDMGGFWNEYTKKFVQMDQAWVDRNFSVGKEKSSSFQYVDVEKSYQTQDKLWKETKLSEVMPNEGAMSMYHYDLINEAAIEAAKAHKTNWKTTDVELLEADPRAAEASKLFPEVKGAGKTSTQVYLNWYLRGLGEKKDALELMVKEAESNPNLAVKGSMAGWRLKGLKKALKDYDLEAGKELTDVQGAAVDILRYIGHYIPKDDLRRMLYKSTYFSKYDLDMERAAGHISLKNYYFKLFENEKPFHRMPLVQGYWPHMGIPKKMRNQWLTEQLQHIESTIDYKTASPEELADARRRVDEIVGRMDEMVADNNSFDGMMNKVQAAEMLEINPELEAKAVPTKGRKRTPVEKEGIAIRKMQELSAQRFGSMFQRKYHVPGYKKTLDVIDDYVSKNTSATYNTLAAFRMKRLVHRLENKKLMGEHTGDWSIFTRMYFRDALGYPTLLPEDVMNSKTLNMKRSPYAWLSDEMAFAKGTMANKFALKVLGLNKLTDADIIRFKLRNKGKEPTDVQRQQLLKAKEELLLRPTPENKQRFANQLRGFSIAEGQYELATLLFASRTGVANVAGGATNIAVWNGAAPLRYIFDISKWQNLNPEWRTFSDLYRWVAETGVIDEYIIHEGGVIVSRYKARGKEFLNAVIEKFRKNPEFEDAKLFELAKEYGITESFLKTAGFFMGKTERLLRINAFLSSYMATRESLKPMPLQWDNPYVIDTAKKAIGITQFLYSNDTRMPFARTNLGKVYSRFKLWAWSSQKFQRQVYEEARNTGMRPDTEEFRRLKRMMMANLFALGLASMLPYTMFESSLPAPLKWFQDLADWMFGDDRQRERAFFAASTGVPRILAPLNELLPPIARIPKGVIDIPGTFDAVFSGDVNAAAALTTYTLFPFGRMTKDVIRAVQRPSRFVEIISGIPFTAIERAGNE